MFPSLGMLIQAILFVLGVWWCREMLHRAPEDLNTWRHPRDGSDRIIILGFWSVTVVVALVCIWFGVSIAMRIVGGIRDLL